MAADVQREGFFARTDALHDFLAGVERQHREQRSEDFFLHDPHRVVDAGQDGGGDEVLGPVGLPAHFDLSAFAHGVVEQTPDAAEVAGVDDAAVVGRGGEALAVGVVEPVGAFAEFLEERRFHRFLHEQVIGGDAGLTVVEKLARFAAQFERDRGEVFGRRSHHDFSHGGTAGEVNVVEGQGEQFACHGGIAFEQGNLGGVEQFGHHSAQQR